MRHITNAITSLEDTRVVTGLEAYVRTAHNDPTLDVDGVLATTVTELTALRQWVFDNFPKHSGSGAWLVSTFDISGQETRLELTPAQTAAFRTEVDDFLASLD